MYFGIDLGTTNSLIGSGDMLFSGLVSSSVDTKERKQVSRDMLGEDIVSSYKVDMTTGTEGELAVECSAVILRTLADYVTDLTGLPVNDIVVSVPAKFTHTQRLAVKKAGAKANLNVVGLINEPTAAAIYVCKDVRDLVAVYDLGGGTFDVSIVDSRGGDHFVVATEGLILAGDDFDKAILQDIYDTFSIKTRFKSKKLKRELLMEVRKAKEQMQKDPSNIYIPLDNYGIAGGIYTFTLDKYIELMKTTFGKTISITKHMIDVYLDGVDMPKIVFVGGSTACPYLREWVCNETGLEEVKCDDAPDYIVAKGVALYAEMLEDGRAQTEINDVTKRLCIEDNKGLTITIIEKNTIIPISESVTVWNMSRSKTLELKLYQGDALVCSENDYIGTLVYEYDTVMEPEQGFVEVNVTVDCNGIITLKGIDLLTQAEQEVRLTVR